MEAATEDIVSLVTDEPQSRERKHKQSGSVLPLGIIPYLIGWCAINEFKSVYIDNSGCQWESANSRI
jgi:hypothetical protein